MGDASGSVEVKWLCGAFVSGVKQAKRVTVWQSSRPLADRTALKAETMPLLYRFGPVEEGIESALKADLVNIVW